MVSRQEGAVVVWTMASSLELSCEVRVVRLGIRAWAHPPRSAFTKRRPLPAILPSP